MTDTAEDPRTAPHVPPTVDPVLMYAETGTADRESHVHRVTTTVDGVLICVAMEYAVLPKPARAAPQTAVYARRYAVMEYV